MREPVGGDCNSRTVTEVTASRGTKVGSGLHGSVNEAWLVELLPEPFQPVDSDLIEWNWDSALPSDTKAVDTTDQHSMSGSCCT